MSDVYAMLKSHTGVDHNLPVTAQLQQLGDASVTVAVTVSLPFSPLVKTTGGATLPPNPSWRAFNDCASSIVLFLYVFRMIPLLICSLLPGSHDPSTVTRLCWVQPQHSPQSGGYPSESRSEVQLSDYFETVRELP